MRKHRIQWVTDPDPDMSWLEHWNTPEGYKGNEVYEHGEPMDFETFMDTYGNPARHIVLGCILKAQCPCCGEWQEDGSLWGCDFMDWEDVEVGTFEPDYPFINPNQREVVADLLSEVAS